MRSRSSIRYLFIVVFIFVAGLAEAKEVSIQHKGLTLNAHLELANGKRLSDGVVLITHAGLTHYGMETYDYLRKLLKESGYSTLSINLSLGISNRLGMYDCKSTHRHRFDDANDEIGAWIGWLERQGVKQVTLLGHSRGGLQTALFAAENDRPLVKSVVLLAPDTQATNDGIAYQQRHNTPLAPILKKAQELVKAGKGNTVLKHTGILYCTDTSVSADTIVSYYGSNPRLDTPYSIPKITKPLLIVIAGGDEIVIGHKDKFIPLADGKRVQVKVVDGADHFFRFLFADDAVEHIDVFMKSAKTAKN